MGSSTDSSRTGTGSGGGRGTGGHFTATEVQRLREEATTRLRRSRTDAAVNSLLIRELVAINERDLATTNEYLDQIENALEDHIDGVERLLLGGSVSKHTYVDGLSDIDLLVMLRDESLANESPETVRERFREALNKYLPQGQILNIRVGRMAVTVDYKDGTQIQLLPAVQSGEDVSVSSADGQTWSRIDPRRFAERLTDANRRQGGAMVPAIKLAKAIFQNTLGEIAPNGYHVEALAIAAFENYDGPRTPRAMLGQLIDSASQNVLRPIRDVTGQSSHVDANLGDRDSPGRRELSLRLSALGNRMSNQTLADWQAMIE